MAALYPSAAPQDTSACAISGAQHTPWCSWGGSWWIRYISLEFAILQSAFVEDVALCTFRGVGYRADYVHVDCVVPCTFRGVRCRADHTYLCGDYLLVLHVVIRGDDLCVDYLDHVDDLDHVDYLAYIAGCRDYFANYLDVVDYVGFFCFACMAVLLCFERHDYVYSYAFLSDLRLISRCLPAP